jgi:predicted membrane-bound spermidine synthase
MLCSAAILPLVHGVVVELAATDNLTELMAGGGSFRASLSLGAYLALLGAGGAAAAQALRLRAARGLWIGVVLVSIPIGWLLLQVGTEAVLVKYGRAFSALQFILSTDRANYAAGVELFLRFLAAHFFGLLICAWSQHLTTMSLPVEGDEGSRGRSGKRRGQ